MLIKRFKRPQPQLVNIVPLASTVPLLNPAEAVSVVSDEGELNALNVCPLLNQGSKLNESIKIIAADNMRFSNKSLSSVSQATELNPQLIFLNYLLRGYSQVKTERTDRGNTKIKKLKFSTKFENFLFYIRSIAANTQDQVAFNIVITEIINKLNWFCYIVKKPVLYTVREGERIDWLLAFMFSMKFCFFNKLGNDYGLHNETKNSCV